MRISEDPASALRRQERTTRVAEALAFSFLVLISAASAAYVKRAGVAPPLVAVEMLRPPAPEPAHPIGRTLLAMAADFPAEAAPSIAPGPVLTEPEAAPLAEPAPLLSPPLAPVGSKWFNGRPVRRARTITMTVTGYSPDSRSCGDSADGLTATLHSVWTNGMKLVAADTRLLPFGSMLSIPGYDAGQIVPVLDRGGAIKGRRLDLLFPTHEMARKWGVKKIRVTVWEYADGKPAADPRTLR